MNGAAAPTATDTTAGVDAPAVETVDLAKLKRDSVRGGMITLGSQGASVLLQLVSTITLARLLTPEDYGVIAMVMTVTAFASLFQDLGLSTASIQKQGITRAQQSNLFWLNVAMGATLTVVVAAMSPLVAWFYGRPELAAVTIALSLNFLIGSLAAQSRAALTREMRFGWQSAAGLIGALTTFLVALTFALRGASYWSLVAGSLTGAVVTTALICWLSPFRPLLWVRRSGVAEMVKFGASLTAFNFVNYFQRNLDNLLIGAVWGAGSLGMYTRAYSLMMLPINAVRGPISTVAFPAMSSLAKNPDALATVYLKATSATALLTMPAIGIAAVASSDIIAIALGQKWAEVAPIFKWLAISALVQPTSGLAGSFLLSQGNGRLLLKCGLLNSVVTAICFIVGCPFHAKGVAIAYAVATYITLPLWLSMAFKGTKVNLSRWARSCTDAVVIATAAAAVALMVLASMQSYSPELRLLALVVFPGTVAGIPAAKLLYRLQGRSSQALA